MESVSCWAVSLHAEDGHSENACFMTTNKGQLSYFLRRVQPKKVYVNEFLSSSQCAKFMGSNFPSFSVIDPDEFLSEYDA